MDDYIDKVLVLKRQIKDVEDLLRKCQNETALEMAHDMQATLDKLKSWLYRHQ